MPIAAVPKYLGRNFQEASPGLRFTIFLPIWTERADQESDKKDLLGLWGKHKQGAGSAWSQVARLSPKDQERIRALINRHKALAASFAPEAIFCIQGEAIAPFTTGLGNEHPLENGFAFLNPYGIPYLAGSGVKGVLRRAAEELASGEPDDSKWSSAPEFKTPFEEEVFDAETGKTVRRRVSLSRLDVLFGRETEEHSTGHFRGVLTFWDVVPEIPGDQLMVEIMTPHHSHYYQQPDKPDGGSTSPHDSGQPNPICFLTVPPGAKFHFCVVCDLPRLRRLAPDLAENGEWKKLLESAFNHAFQWVGFGAKTAVGYGAMMAPKKTTTPATPATPAGAGSGKPAAPAQPSGAIEWRGAQLKWDPGQQAITGIFQNKKTAPLRGEAMTNLLNRLGTQKAEQLKKTRSLAGVALRVTQEGNLFRIVDLLEG